MIHQKYFLIHMFLLFVYAQGQYTVTNIDSSSYKFEPDPENLVKGETYTFNVDALLHPLWFTTAAADLNTKITSGINNNGEESNIITYTIPKDFQGDKIYYVCGTHSGMQGEINVVNADTNKGDKGEPSAQGLQGPDGPAGADGAQGLRGFPGCDGAIMVSKYYPLYTSEYCANEASPSNSHHKHELLNMIYYMPDGLNQTWHGDYDGAINIAARGDKGDTGDKGDKGDNGDKGDGVSPETSIPVWVIVGLVLSLVLNVVSLPSAVMVYKKKVMSASSSPEASYTNLYTNTNKIKF